MLILLFVTVLVFYIAYELKEMRAILTALDQKIEASVERQITGIDKLQSEF